MLSPRTLSLRSKNRALLKALDECSEVSSRKWNDSSPCQSDRIPFCKNCDEFFSFKPHSGDCTHYYTRHCLKANDVVHQSGAINELRQSTCSHNDGNNCDKITDRVNASCIASSRRFNHEIQTESCSQLSSTNESGSKIRGIIEEMREEHSSKNSFNMVNQVNRDFTQSTMKACKTKSVSLEQQRAAEAQMHAPTHTHLMSKCYCTLSQNLRVQPDSRYIVQVYGHKQRIPSRLKKQRYRTDSLPRHERMVTWADHQVMTSDHYNAENDASMSLSRKPSQVSLDFVESPRVSHTRQSSLSSLDESQNSLLDKVKTFRESHWYDCHASPRQGTLSSDHERAQHYVLNERLFLEPLHTDHDGESDCPVCRRPSTTYSQPIKQNHHHPHFQVHERHNKSSHILVTLPKVALELDQLHSKLIAGVPSSGRQNGSKKILKQKSCFLLGHHKQLAEENTSFCPTDSLALRYQKKLY